MEPVHNSSHGAAALPRWLLAAVVGVGVLAYASGLSGPFIFDDISSIPDNQNIRQLWPLSRAMSAPPLTTVSGRPTVCLSLALNYAIGGLSVQGYHAFNLAIHLGSALLLLGIIRRTLLTPTLAGRFERAAPWLAAASAAIWMLHPLQTEAVTYVIQRTELLMGFFFLLTLYCAIRGWASSSHRMSWFAAAVASCAFGMGSKEVMVSAPLIVLLYDRTFVSRSWRAAFRRHPGLYGGLAATWLVLAWLIGTGARDASVGSHLDIRPLHYLETQAGVIARYLRLCFWPRPLVISYDDWPVAHHLTEVLPQALLILALLAGTLWALVRRPALGFLGGVFFLILAPTSSFVPIVTEVAAERRMYLPLAAVVVLTAVSVYRLSIAAFTRLSLPPAFASRAGAALVIITVGVLGLATTARNQDYRSEAAIWGDTVAKRPGIAFAQFEFGKALAKEGRTDQAMAHYEEAVRLKPSYHEAHNNLGNLLADRGRLDIAAMHYQEAIRAKPDSAEAHNNLGTVLTSQGKLDMAVAEFTEALRHDPSLASAHSNLGVVLARLGRTQQAIEHFRKAIEAAPLLAQPHFELARLLADLGRLDEAITQYQQALRIDPNYPAARERLEAVISRRNKTAHP